MIAVAEIVGAMAGNAGNQNQTKSFRYLTWEDQPKKALKLQDRSKLQQQIIIFEAPEHGNEMDFALGERSRA
ncbi:hypothetical protein M5689_006979 [Euphorbia peplus]|nr:hypothetical protein M5689_006979 [Euphorbia peplus]